MGRKQEPQNVIESGRPVAFIMPAFGNFDVLELDTLDQPMISELPGKLPSPPEIGRDPGLACSLLATHVEPDAGRFEPVRVVGKPPQEIFAIPPDRRGHRRTLTEHLGVPFAQLQRNQSPHRRPGDAGRLGFPSRSERVIDKGLQLFDEKSAIPLSQVGALLLGIRAMAVFAEPIGCVADADDQKWLTLAGPDHSIGNVVTFPRVPGKRCRSIEEVLSIVHVQHGVASFGIPVVLWWQIDGYLPRVNQVLRAKVGVVFHRVATPAPHQNVEGQWTVDMEFSRDPFAAVAVVLDASPRTASDEVPDRLPVGKLDSRAIGPVAPAFEANGIGPPATEGIAVAGQVNRIRRWRILRNVNDEIDHRGKLRDEPATYKVDPALATGYDNCTGRTVDIAGDSYARRAGRGERD